MLLIQTNKSSFSLINSLVTHGESSTLPCPLFHTAVISPCEPLGEIDQLKFSRRVIFGGNTLKR